MSPTQTARRSPDAFDSRFPEKRDMGAELDNIFRLTAIAPESAERASQERTALERSRPPAPAAPLPEPRRVSQADLDVALDMLTRAAQAMDILQARYQQVESYARDIAQRAERDLASAYGQIKEWETRALASEAKLEEQTTRADDAEGQAQAALRGAEASERHAEVAQHRAEQAERGASEAREWLECFHDKIVASFDTRPFPRVAIA